jgi:hypothetical protein
MIVKHGDIVRVVVEVRARPAQCRDLDQLVVMMLVVEFMSSLRGETNRDRQSSE